MTNVTLALDDEVYKKMKSFSEIRWSEFVRICIQQKIIQLEKFQANIQNYEKSLVLADEELLAEDWLSEEDKKAWKDL